MKYLRDDNLILKKTKVDESLRRLLNKATEKKRRALRNCH